MSTTILEFTRSKARLVKAMSHKIFVDGQILGAVCNGRTITLEVTSGRHTVYVSPDLCTRSNELVLHCAPNQTVRLQVTQKIPLLQRTKTCLILECSG